MSVAAGNTAAISLYERTGFRALWRAEDAITMLREPGGAGTQDTGRGHLSVVSPAKGL